jgi:hypothetical protein
MSCICQSCGNQYKLDLLIPSILWKKIRSDKNLMCAFCIMLKLERMFGYSAFELKEIK